MSEFLEVNFDTRELDRAVKLRLQFPGRTEAEIVNTAAFWIAANAKQRTPFVPQARIDTSLNVIVDVKVGPRGGKSKRYSSAPGGDSKTPGKSLGYMIVLARANLTKRGRQSGQSEYNRRTNNRFALSKSDLEGGNRTIRGYVERMIKARHSATSFLKSGWVRAVKALRPFAVNKFRRGSAPPMEGAREDHGGMPRGDAIPAVEGAWHVTAMIENATGMAGSVNAANYNQALIQHGAPALQEAIDIESTLMLEYAEKKLAEENQRAFAKCVA